MVTNFAITGNMEILHVADAVAREKGIPHDAVINALQEAIETVAKRKYGHEHTIHAEIDQKTGAITLCRTRKIVEEVENFDTELSLEDAKQRDAELELGDHVLDPLPPIDFGRVTSQTFKQVILQKIRDAEREKQFLDFQDRIGEIVTGVIKRIEYGNLIIDFGKTETILPRDQLIPRENYRVGDRIRAYIVDVRRELKGPQIFLSRTHPDFLRQLFAQEVPEIYDGVVTIKAVVRDAGSRAKCAVTSNDSSIDPAGACIGPRGVRVTAVYNELQGEKIDIIEWSPDLATFAVNALTSKSRDAVVEVSKIIIDEDRHLLEAVVPDDQLSLAIGRRGQNVRLASELIGWNIDVVSESDESKRRVEEFNSTSELFSSALTVEEIIGQLLASEGFKTLEEVAYVPLEDIASIEGFDAGIAEELQNRAKEYLTDKQEKTESAWKKLGVDASLLELDLVTDTLMVSFGEKGIKTLDDLGDLAADEFIELIPDSGLTEEQINALIMKAREHWFPEEEDTVSDADDAADDSEKQSA